MQPVSSEDRRSGTSFRQGLEPSLRWLCMHRFVLAPIALSARQSCCTELMIGPGGLGWATSFVGTLDGADRPKWVLRLRLVGLLGHW